jgi:hypothetical protein
MLVLWIAASVCPNVGLASIVVKHVGLQHGFRRRRARVCDVTTGRSARVDGLGRAYAGSQLQIQIYVNRRSEELSEHVLRALPSLSSPHVHLRWVSPLESERFVEYQDRAFLEAVEQGQLARSLREFWPPGGPTWDALALAEPARGLGEKGVVLVEAKSHPSEIYGGGCRASSRSRERIVTALEKTKRWLGVPGDAGWTGPLYQSANRLAHLYFFREVARIPAWLVNALFLDDPHSPTGRGDWQTALAQVKAELGLTSVDIPHTGEVFLKARERRELVGR